MIKYRLHFVLFWWILCYKSTNDLWVHPEAISGCVLHDFSWYLLNSFFLSWHFSAISGSGVPEWVEFVAVWLPTSNGFLNCVFYFWINRSFRRKFHCVLQRLCFGLCPNTKPLHDSVMATLNNNTVQERSSSVSSTCTLLTAAVETYIWPPGTKPARHLKLWKTDLWGIGEDHWYDSFSASIVINFYLVGKLCLFYIHCTSEL